MATSFKILSCFTLLIMVCCTPAKHNNTEDEAAIRNVLQKQALAWSEGNIMQYMEGYWKSDSLKSIGSSGPTYGWKNTLNKYLKSYPTAAHTGKLQLEISSLTPLGTTHYHVIGRYTLRRDVGDLSGVFSLLMKKINGEWKIIIDHSC